MLLKDKINFIDKRLKVHAIGCQIQFYKGLVQI